MPGQDRTGPLGEGSRTGRGLGLCGRRRNTESTLPRLGLAHRRGRRRGNRWGGPWDTPWAGLWRGPWFTRTKQGAWLREREHWLEERLRTIHEQIEALEQADED